MTASMSVPTVAFHPPPPRVETSASPREVASFRFRTPGTSVHTGVPPMPAAQ